MRRRELRLRARLPEEALKREVVIAPGKNDLQRDSAIGRAIVRDIDDAHAAASDLTLRW